jgi:signal transduction histidine kinase
MNYAVEWCISYTLMDVVSCLLVGMDGPSCAVARGATRLAFSGCVVAARRSLEEALLGEMALGVELLVLANPDRDEATRAAEAADTTGLRRWAIVVLGTAPEIEGVEIVSPGEWSEPLLARVFRAAVELHQLRRANARLVGDLRTIAHRISHDLRTPLGGILSTGEALSEVLAERDPSSVTLANSLFDSVGDLGTLVDRVSLLTRASANPAPKRAVEMEEVVWAVLQRFERRILKAGAVIIRPAFWPAVQGVSAWLETVWSNLVINALEHAKESTRIELGWSRNEGEFRFWVRDYGHGIPAEKRQTLLQPFHWLHLPNARKGLGLSIVQRLMELQEGFCGYEPVATGGSIFYFTLPAGNRSGGSDKARDRDIAASVFSWSPTSSKPDFRQVTEP